MKERQDKKMLNPMITEAVVNTVVRERTDAALTWHCITMDTGADTHAALHGGNVRTLATWLGGLAAAKGRRIGRLLAPKAA
jgi:hypothetical protein